MSVPGCVFPSYLYKALTYVILYTARTSNKEIVGETFDHLSFIKFSAD